MRFSLCLLIGFASYWASASEVKQDTTRNGDRDTSYIRVTKEPWNFRLYSVNKISEMILHTPNDSLPAASYNPKAKIGVGVGAFYRSFGAWIGLRVDAFDKSKNTVQYDLQLNQYAKRFVNDLYLQYYEGIYLTNAIDFAHLGPIEESRQFRPDLRTFHVGLNSNYYRNWKRFSTRAPFVQSELQLKNAGSTIFGGTVTQYSFDADSSIIPKATQLQPDQAIRAGQFLTVAANLGYAYTFVWGKYAYVNVNAVAGPGLTRWEYQVDNAAGYAGIRPMLRLGGRLSAGYNVNQFFAGMSAVFDQFTIFYNQNTVSYVMGNMRLFIGYRPKINSGKSRR